MLRLRFKNINNQKMVRQDSYQIIEKVGLGIIVIGLIFLQVWIPTKTGYEPHFEMLIGFMLAGWLMK